MSKYVNAFSEEKYKEHIKPTGNVAGKFQLPMLAKNRIQGMAGEIIAIEYVFENYIRLEGGDEVIYASHRRERTVRPSKRKGAKIRYLQYDSPTELVKKSLSHYFQFFNFDAIDLKNADHNAKRLFKKFSAKTKEKMLKRIEEYYDEYEAEGKRELDEERRRLESNNELVLRLKEEREKTLKAFSKLSIHNLAKALTIAEIDYQKQKKQQIHNEYRRLNIPDILDSYKYKSIRDEKGRSIFLDRSLGELVKQISIYANAEFENIKIFSTIYNSLIKSRVRIDIIIIHFSRDFQLKKVIFIEAKTGNSKLSTAQKEFANAIYELDSDKVEFKVLNIDFKMDNCVKVTEY